MSGGGGPASNDSKAFVYDDAPANHAAYDAIRYHDLQNGHAFRFTTNKDPISSKREMIQVTVTASSNSLSHAARICRLCYVYAECSRTKSEIMEYRGQLYEELRLHPPNEETDAEKQAIKDVFFERSQKGKDLAKQQEVEDLMRNGEVAINTIDTSQFEDAPVDHLAHTKVRFCTLAGDQQAWRFSFNIVGQSVLIQTTVKASHGSIAHAGRICRLCYLQAEAGKSKEDIVIFRNSLYKELAESLHVSAKGETEDGDNEPNKLKKTRKTQKRETGIVESMDHQKFVKEGRDKKSRKEKKAKGKEETVQDQDEVMDDRRAGKEGGDKKAKKEKKSKKHKRRKEEDNAGYMEDPSAAEDKERPGTINERRASLDKDLAGHQEIDQLSRNDEVPDDTIDASRFEDAPADHLAHTHVKFFTLQSAEQQAWRFNFRIDGRSVQIQTTVRASQGSKAHAGRICRLCYLHAEAGKSKEDIVLYRNTLYKELVESLNADLHGRFAANRESKSKKEKKTKRENESNADDGAEEIRDNKAAERMDKKRKHKEPKENPQKDQKVENHGRGAEDQDRLVQENNDRQDAVPAKERKQHTVEVDMDHDPATVAEDGQRSGTSQGLNAESISHTALRPELLSESSSRSDSTSSEESESDGARTAERRRTLVAKALGRVQTKAAAKMLCRSGLRCACHFSLIGSCPGLAQS